MNSKQTSLIVRHHVVHITRVKNGGRQYYRADCTIGGVPYSLGVFLTAPSPEQLSRLVELTEAQACATDTESDSFFVPEVCH